MTDLFGKVPLLVRGRERWQLYGVIAATIVRSIIEVAGVASVMPFLSIVSDPETIQTNEYLNWAYETFAFTSTESFLFAVGLGVLFLLLFNNGFAIFTLWLRFRFILQLKYSLSRRLLNRYLGKSYVFFLNQNSSALNKNILTEADQAGGVLLSMLEIMARAVVTLFILGLLLFVNVRLALVVFAVLGVAYGLVWIFVRRKLRVISDERFEANRKRFKVSSEAFDSIKIAKLMRREEFFLHRFDPPARRYAQHQATSQIISQTPKFVLEGIAFGGILVMVLYLLGTGAALKETIPLIGLYAFAGYRLMPALQAIYSHISSVRFGIPSINVVYEDLNAPSQDVETRSTPDPPLPVEEEFGLENVTFAYPDTDEPAVQDVTTRIPVGSSVGFVGPTGAGKTTVIDLILGLLRPDEGHLVVDGKEVDDEILPRWQSQIGYVPQDITLSDDTIRRNIAFGLPGDQIDEEAVRRAARLADIASFIEDSLADGYETTVGERGVRLSGGQRQRIGIARALYHEPKVLIFDEATSDLDNATEQAIVDAIDRLRSDSTIIQIAHRLETVRDSDVIFMVQDGRIAARGTFDELIESNRQFRELAQVT